MVQSAISIKKTENGVFKIVNLEEFLKFYVNKDATKNSLSVQLTSISAKLPKLKDKNIYHFSLTKMGEKRKRQMAEPIETVIICVQQSFEIASGLNPVQIEIDDDIVLNMLKKYKNARYRLTPLGLLFPATVKNDTEQIFITCRELNDVKKSPRNSKIYLLLGIIDLKKINNWGEIKEQSLWINSTLEEQKEINNSRYLCFLFTTSTLNDLLNFSINLIDDNNKQITFEDSKKN